jgi:ribonuclease P protein component
MLPVRNRLRRPDEFAAVVRHGRRAGRQTLVVHVIVSGRDDGEVAAAHPREAEPSRVGFIVSKAIGDAVTRNRVKRRLRHLAGDRLANLPPGVWLVVRALPGAAKATHAELADDLDRAIARALRSGTRPANQRSDSS